MPPLVQGHPTPTAPGCRCSHLPQGLRAALQQQFNSSQQAAIAGGMAGGAQITLVQVGSLSGRSLAVPEPELQHCRCLPILRPGTPVCAQCTQGNWLVSHASKVKGCPLSEATGWICSDCLVDNLCLVRAPSAR